MWELINFFGCVGWIMGCLVLVGILAQRDANKERERMKAAKEQEAQSDNVGGS
jgi:hypothetical protein